jgi:hypothetical protein
MKTQIVAYTYNSCKQCTPIPVTVKTLGYWKNKECRHEINPNNINEFLGTKYNENKPFIISYSGTLIKSTERVFNDLFVDFIHISYN